MFRFSIKYKKCYELTEEQKQALVGIILADGFLERVKSTHNTRLRIDHTYPNQEKYVLHLYNLFLDLVKTEPKILKRKPDIRTGSVYSSIAFKTLKFPCLNYYYDLFYRNSIKIIPTNIEDLLTP